MPLHGTPGATMTLEFARSHPVEPGTNQRGEQADTTWLFLLPSLELRDVVVVGSAPFGTLLALDALASRLTVARPSLTMRRRLRRLVARRAEAAPISVHARDLPSGAADLVYVARGRSTGLARDEHAVRWLGNVLESGGSVYVGARARGGHTGAIDLARRLAIGTCVSIGRPDGGPEVVAPGGPSAWLIPAAAQPASRWARPAVSALRAARRLTLRVARRPSVGASVRVSEPESSLGVRGAGPLPAKPIARTGVLLRGPVERGSELLPEYLARTAAANGTPLLASGWRLAPPRGYRSQKIIFFAHLHDGTRVVVKLTQEPRFNRLLDNEAAALARLAEVELGDALVVPALWFRSAHGGLTVVAQDALEGRAFVNVASPGPRSEHAGAVARALLALATKTKQPGSDVAEALLEIVGRYRSLYGVTTAHAHRLEEHARMLGALGGDLPAVFMHGDATVYNVLVGADSRIGLVDWENAEATGMPLWDLFHFGQAHAGWTAEQAGVRYTPNLFALQFLGDDAAQASASPTIKAACHELELPDRAVEPLKYTWLAWHAAREARQLPPSRLTSGFYHRVLAGALDR